MTSELDNIILREFGLDVKSDGTVVDQNSSTILSTNGKVLNINDNPYNHNTVLFEPSKNTKQMSVLFKHFLDNVEDEGGDSFNAIYDFDSNKETGTSRLGCTGHFSKIESNAYVNESLKYLDCAMQINGEENPDLSKYDMSKKEYDKLRKEYINKNTKKYKNNSK